MSDNQVWFERWGWTYTPCHWKGWAAFAFAALTGVLLILTSEWAMQLWTGSSDLRSMLLVIRVAGFIVAGCWFLSFVDRHSAPASK